MPKSIDEVVRALMSKGWRPNPPASSIQIINLERHFGVLFPHDFREFFGISNGGGPRAAISYRGLMNLAELPLFNQQYRVPQNFPGLVAFANEGFLVYAFDFRGESAVVSSLGLSSSLWDDVVQESASFAEWLEEGLAGYGRG